MAPRITIDRDELSVFEGFALSPFGRKAEGGPLRKTLRKNQW
jgi:hypothetical protein